MAAVSSVASSSDIRVSALTSDWRWASTSMTYSFPVAPTNYESGYPNNEPAAFGTLNLQQQAAARGAFANFAAVAMLSFSEVPASAGAISTATIRLGLTNAGTAWAYGPSPSSFGGDVWFDRNNFTTPVRGEYEYATFLHEIGHALGLLHPHENGMPNSADSLEYTLMSYRSFEGAPLNGYSAEAGGFPQSLMMYDIAAMQHMYGANFATQSGSTTYRWSPDTGQSFVNGVAQAAPLSNRIFQTVWDGGGTDTFDFSNYASNLNVDLRPGKWTTVSPSQLAQLDFGGTHIADGNIANALMYNNDPRSLIENAIGGSGNDTLVGNSANNNLVGGAGSDILRGEQGNDVIDGSSGTDTVQFQGVRSEYSITHDSNGVFTVRDLVAGRDGLDTVVNVETWSFADQTLSSSSVSDEREVRLVLADFGPGVGWSSTARFPREVADVNGDGKADIVGFGDAGVYVALGNGGGGFHNATFALSGFGASAGGWDKPQYLRDVVDVNGDGRADIVGFGYDGVYISRSGSNGFQDSVLAVKGFSAGAGGWSDNDRYPREMADINGDGRADIVGFGDAGVYVGLANPDGTYSGPNLVLEAFSASAGGWRSNDRYPRRLADVNGDGAADIVGFGAEGVYVSLANRAGGFAAPIFAIQGFGPNAGGWSSNDRYPRMMADMNGDGRADIVAFGAAGVYVAHGQANGTFAPAELELADLGTDQSWSSQSVSTRTVADVTADGQTDFVAFGHDGVYVGTTDWII